MTTHIMEIYFRAWKKATGEFQEQIETSCIQDFMHNAIFLHRSSPVHAKVRQVNFKSSIIMFIFYSVLYSPTHSFSCADYELFPFKEGLPHCGQNALWPLQAHSLESSKCKNADLPLYQQVSSYSLLVYYLFVIHSGSKLWGARKRDFAFHRGLPSPRPGAEQQEYRRGHPEAVGRCHGKNL